MGQRGWRDGAEGEGMGQRRWGREGGESVHREEGMKQRCFMIAAMSTMYEPWSMQLQQVPFESI